MKLVFVYNADSGIFNTLTDISHKLFSPDTYECNLCNLTHGYFKARDEWVTFLRNHDAELEFLHRDEYLKQSGAEAADIDLPAIFVKEAEQLKLWVDKSAINKLTSTDDLIELIKTAESRKRSS